MTKEQINNLEVEFEVVKARLEIAQELVTNQGFYKLWFEQLASPHNKDKTKLEVFEKVNNLYQKVFNLNNGRYSSYDSFSKIVKRLRLNDK